MKKTSLLGLIEDFCRMLAITIKYDRFFGQGGYCRLRDKSYFIINEGLSNEAKEQIFIDELKTLKLDAELPPKLQELINKN